MEQRIEIEEEGARSRIKAEMNPRSEREGRIRDDRIDHYKTRIRFRFPSPSSSHGPTEVRGHLAPFSKLDIRNKRISVVWEIEAESLHWRNRTSEDACERLAKFDFKMIFG
jgi:hypothetical protein